VSPNTARRPTPAAPDARPVPIHALSIREIPLNVKSSALTAAALTAAGLVLSAGAANAATPRITSHEQLQASISAAVAAIAPAEAGADLSNPVGRFEA